MARRSTHTSGMQGVFLVAAELAAREYIVSPTSRSAFGADLLVTDAHCRKAFTVQVKTNRSNPKFWLVGSRVRDSVSPTHVYAFVNLNNGNPLYYFVPSNIVAEQTRIDKHPRSTWYSWHRDEARRDRWDVFGASG